MITTLTWNPSLDYVVTVQNFQQGKTNRTMEEQLYPGGKGINVSLVLKRLGITSRILGFSAGFSGKEIERLIKELGLEPEFIPLSSGYSRINVKWKDSDSTELNGMGPMVTKQEISLLYDKLEKLNTGDILVLAGSVSRGMTKRVYREIMDHLAGKGVRFVVDACGELLRQTLEARPFLVKPNHQELEELFGVKIQNIKEAAYYGKKLQKEGVENVLVSMGGEGAVLVAGDGKTWYQKVPKGAVVNTVGSGDSMVAGFLTGFLEHGEYKNALALGTAAGSASAFSEELAHKKEIIHLFNQMEEPIYLCV